MAHTYTSRALPTTSYVYRDGEPFAVVSVPQGYTTKADCLAVMRFTEALPEVVAALAEALDDLEWLSRASDSAYAKPDPETLDKARKALQSIGAI